MRVPKVLSKKKAKSETWKYGKQKYSIITVLAIYAKITKTMKKFFLIMSNLQTHYLSPCVTLIYVA